MRIICLLGASSLLGACVCQGPDRLLEVTESTRITFDRGQPVETPLTCTPADFTVQCPIQAYDQRITVEAIKTDSLGRWAIVWWAPDGVNGLSVQHLSTGPLVNECLSVDPISDNTGLMGAYSLCRSSVNGAEQWTTTIQWELRAVAGFSRFSFATGLAN